VRGGAARVTDEGPSLPQSKEGAAGGAVEAGALGLVGEAQGDGGDEGAEVFAAVAEARRPARSWRGGVEASASLAEQSSLGAHSSLSLRKSPQMTW